MTSSWKWWLLALMAGMLQNTSLRAATYGTNSFADTFVGTGATGSLINSNYGGSGALSVAASALSKGEFQTVLRFDLAGAKSSFDSLYGAGQWTIQSITLQLTAASPNNGIFNASGAGQFGVAWMQNSSWQEGTGTPPSPSAAGLTFNSLTNNFVSGGDQGLGIFSFGGGTSGANSYSLTLAPNFSTDVLAGNTVSFRLFAADSTLSYLLNSHEFGTAASRPLLTVSAVPEPASGMLAAVAFAVLAGRNGFTRMKQS